MRRKGLLLINLGSPENPSPKAVGRYLRQFLSDPYVIDLPVWARFSLVNLLIVPFRAHKSAEAYQKIWTEKGSPLVQTTKSFSEKVATAMGAEWDVRWAMRYGQPSIKKTLADWHVDELYVVPLYPQYAQSSTQTAIDEVHAAAKHIGKIKILKDFFHQPEFIEAQAKRIQHSVEKFNPDHVLLSFHGLPEHHLTKLHEPHCLKHNSCCEEVTEANRFCYRAQSVATAKALKKSLSLDEKKISYAFQSRLGRRPWIKPYTDVWVNELFAQGSKRILVSCPSFVADCLETLEEIELRLKDQFQALGGDLQLVPALNDDDEWVSAFKRMILRPDVGWINA